MTGARGTPILEVEGLTVEFATHDGVVRAVDDVSFTLDEGEVLGLVGESGSGKTVTCRALIHLLPSHNARVVAGSVRFDGVELTALDEAGMEAVRGEKIGMIFQNPMTHLNPVMTIGDQVAEPLRVHEGLPREAALEHAADLLRQVGIPDPSARLKSFPHEFSGGMRQRAMIAAALACKPKLLIADEPTTALDVTVQAQILRLLLDLRERNGLAIILISHDLGVVAQTCDSVAVMYAGRIVERAAKSDLVRRPLHPYTAGLISSQPGSAPPLEELPSIAGQPPSLADLPPGCRFHPRCNYVEAACRAAPPALAPVAAGRASACLRWQLLQEVS